MIKCIIICKEIDLISNQFCIWDIRLLKDTSVLIQYFFILFKDLFKTPYFPPLKYFLLKRKGYLSKNLSLYRWVLGWILNRKKVKVIAKRKCKICLSSAADLWFDKMVTFVGNAHREWRWRAGRNWFNLYKTRKHWKFMRRKFFFKHNVIENRNCRCSKASTALL